MTRRDINEANIVQEGLNTLADDFATGVTSVSILTLSSEQILALNSTPLIAVAAPGANKAVIPLNVGFSYQRGETDYATFGVGCVLGWFIGGGGVTGSDIFDLYRGDIFAASLSQIGVMQCRAGPGAGIWSSDLGDVENQPLMFGADAGNPTLGDGTCVIGIAYIVIPVL